MLIMATERSGPFIATLRFTPSPSIKILPHFTLSEQVTKTKPEKAKEGGFNRNFSLSSLCNDTEFISKFNEVPELIEDFAPEILILQMGVDGSKRCTISGMQLTQNAYDYASRLLADLQKEHRFKILALGGGGFVHPMLGQNWGVQIQNFIGW
jgi:acetoin utilization deacetylase AcuC-like enzyme